MKQTGASFLLACLLFGGCAVTEAPQASVVTFEGEVKRPGEYVITDSTPYLEALKLAEGYTVNADASCVLIKRGTSRVVEDMRMTKSAISKSTAEKFVLYPGDTVIVPKRK